jgi:hypothetical protein
MTEKVLQPTGDEVDVTENHVQVTKGELEHVESHVFIVHGEGTATSASEVFTRNAFEDALDKVSRPVKGKYAHVPYSSKDLIRDKRAEAELEDRQP